MAMACGDIVRNQKCLSCLLLPATRILIFDGGKSRERGCYGSWCILHWVTCGEPDLCSRRRKCCPAGEFHMYRICEASRRRLVERYTFSLPHLRTSNEAEWAAFCRGLSAIQEHGIEGDVVIVGDSLLVLNQFTGRWQIWADNLRPLRDEALGLARQLEERGCALRCEWRPRHVIAAWLGH